MSSFSGGGFGAFSGGNAFGNKQNNASSGTSTPPNIFGQPPSTPGPTASAGGTTPTGTPAPSAFGSSNLFGGGQGSTTPTSSPAKPAFGTTNVFGSSSFGSQPVTSAPTSTTSAAPSSITPSTGFSGFGAAKPPETNPSASTPAPPAAPAGGTSLFGGSGSFGSSTSAFSLFGGASKQPDAPATTPAPAAPTATSTAPPFGGGGSFGSFGRAPTPDAATNKDQGKEKEAEKGTAAAGAPLAGFATAPGSTGGVSTSAFSLFGGAPKQPDTPATMPAPAAPTATSTAPLFGGGGSFGSFGKAATPDAATDKGKEKEAEKGTAAAGAPPAGSNIFSTFGVKKPEEPVKPAATSTTPAGASASAPPGNIFSTFGAKKPEEPAKPATTSTTPAGASAGASTSTAAPAAGASPAPGSTSVPAGPPPSLLKGKTLEDIIAKWNADLDTQSHEFQRMANEVAVWDRALMENSEKMNFLYTKVAAAVASQSSVEDSLKHIEEQQNALNRTLDSYEQQTKAILNMQGRQLDLGPANRERDNSYGLASSLNSQLDDLALSLTSMIDIVNALGSTSVSDAPSASQNGEFPGDGGSGTDPIAQIEAILNAHLGSLQWIGETVKELEGKVKEVEARQQQQSDRADGGGSDVSSLYEPVPRGGYGIGRR